MTVVKNISWEKVLPTNTAEAVKNYIKHCREWRAEGIDLWPSCEGYKSFCEGNGFAFDEKIGNFFTYASEMSVAITPKEYKEFTIWYDTSVVDDDDINPMTKLLALLGLEFATIGAAVTAFAAWIVPFI